VVGYHRHDTPSKLLLLNKIWILQSLVTNYFLPPAAAELISKVRRCINRARRRILLVGHQAPNSTSMTGRTTAVHARVG